MHWKQLYGFWSPILARILRRRAKSGFFEVVKSVTDIEIGIGAYALIGIVISLIP
jgi:hypothetical protein